MALAGIELPVDVIVVTPQELDRQKNLKGTVLFTALREGRVLYERAA